MFTDVHNISDAIGTLCYNSAQTKNVLN